mgnify:CR=1 FL=1
MKKTLLLGLVGILLLIVIGVAVVVSSLNSIIKTGIETVGPEVVGVPVTVEAVELSLLAGEARVKGLVVGNPKGFQTASAFKLGDARVKVDLNSVLTDKLIIEEIVVEAPDVTYEAALSGSNIGKIQENVGAFSKSIGGGGPAAKPAPGSDSEKKKVQINHFIVRNGHVNASAVGLQGKGLTIPLPDIHLKDIGKESQGATMQQASSEMMAALNKSVLQAVSGSGKFLTKGAEAIGEAAKDLGGDAGKAGAQAVEGLKGLFGK